MWGAVAEQPALSFAGLLRRLREQARLTQEELAEAAGLSPRSVSDLERGIHPTARKDTALLLADALSLAGPARELFVAVARGRTPAAEVLAAAREMAPGAFAAGAARGLPRDTGSLTTSQACLVWLLGTVTGSPYRGLSAFGEQDAAFFFGREMASAQVLERMSRRLEGTGLLVVSGVSGAGKTSLLRAGALPRIRETGLASAPGSRSWPCVLFTPTRAPLDELALRVALLAGADASAVRRGLAADPAGFALTARQAALAEPHRPAAPAAERDQPPQRRLLLVVDQFEQLFTQCADEGQRRAFITALHAAASARHGPHQPPAALVVLGVRADFEARCADYPQLTDAVQDRYLVTSMTERQLRLAISEPAKKAGSRIDDDLVGVLLAEVRNGQPGTFGAGVLPLLSHALDQAWRCRTGETVALGDYERTGGIEGAVADSAQRTYDRLTPAQQAAARHVFTRLTTINTEGVDSADRATRAELTEGKSAAEAQDVETVLEAFAAQRLLTLAAGTVEISHEALLTAWPLLHDTWLTETRADRIVRTRLHNTAADWARHSHDPSYLYSGSLLQAANETSARIGADPARNPPLSPTDRDFLHASGHARRRRARRRRAVIAGLLALSLTAIAAAGIALHNAANATRQHTLALSRQLAAESLSINPVDPVTARRLAVAAWRVFPTAEASSAMTALLVGQQQSGILPADPREVSDVAFSPNGKLLATTGSDGTVRLWNPVTDQAVGAPLQAGRAQGGASVVAFSPDGKLLATASGNSGTVRVWNSVTRRPVGTPLHSDGSGVYGLAFSPDSKLLASEDGNATVRFWNTVTRQPFGAPLQTHGSEIGVSFSPSGKLVTADSKGTVRLWDPLTHNSAPLLTGSHAHSVSAVAFSPDGKLLATAGSGTVQLWNPVTRQPVGAPLRVTGSHVGVFDVEFSPSGKLLASADGNGTVRLWNPVTRQPVGAPLRVTSAQVSVFGVAFSANSKVLATADSDGTVRLWDLVNSQPAGAALETGALGGVNGVAFSHDSKLLASAGSDGVLRLWNPLTGEPAGAPLKTGVQSDSLGGVVFSPDGKLLATVDVFSTVWLWDPLTRRPAGAPLPAKTGPNEPAYDVAFSPDGKLLATADGNMVRLWNPVTRQPAGPPLHAAAYGVSAVAFSPNGKLLATIDHGGTVRAWNPVTRQPAGPPIHARPEGGHLTGLEKVAFSPDSKLLASADGGTVRLWNPVTGQAVGPPLPAETGTYAGVYDVAFSPDGKLLASAGSDGTVQLWNPVTSQPVGPPLATGALNGVYGVAFSADGRWLASAGSDGAIHLWNTSLLTHPYAALCADVGPPTQQDWAKYAPGEPQPRICP
jgi:WD40 repeat protein/transcriptional regulator with XRE-family HTH domain